MKLKKVCSLFLAVTFLSFLLAGIFSPDRAFALAEYNVSASADYSGPYADMFLAMDNGRKIVLAWWNETVGKELGVKLNYKPYDMRYDATVVASLWPGILSGLKPIAHLGEGGPSVAALMQRLPTDKIPMFMSTATYGYIWLPNQWVFQARPSYAHEFAGFLAWVRSQQKDKKPIRFATISTQGIPAYEDGVNGGKKLSESIKDFQFVGVEWVPTIPVDISSQVRRLVKEKPDFIWIMTNLTQNAATHRALQELGVKIPLVFSSHNGIIESTKAIDLKEMEGYFDTMAMATQLDTDIEAYKIHETFKKDIAPKNPWGIAAIQGMNNAIVMLRTIERVVKKVGPDKLTGEAIYEAAFEKDFTEQENLGLLPTLKYTKEAPFSAEFMKVKSTTVKNGKEAKTFEGWFDIPSFPKW